MADHVTWRRGGVWAARGGGASLGLDLQPGLAQRLGEVVIHRARDGHRVGAAGRAACARRRGHLRLLVVLAQAAAEVLLDHRVAHRAVGCGESGRERSCQQEVVSRGRAQGAFTSHEARAADG